MNKKNVLFIIADQFRGDCIGRGGNTIVKTPNLDRLAEEGVLFNSAYCQTSPCGPSRMCIYTSTYLCRNRTTTNCMPLKDAHENMAMDLFKKGYEPILLGYNDYAVDPEILEEGDFRKTNHDYDSLLPGFKWGLDHEYDSKEYFESLREKGYSEELLNKKEIHKNIVPSDYSGAHADYYFPGIYNKEDSECWYITDATINTIKNEKEKRENNESIPGWVVNLNYIKPHPPMVGCEEFLKLFDNVDLPMPHSCDEELNSDHPVLKYFMKKEIKSEQHIKDLIRCYYAMIYEVDYNLGRILKYLEDSGQKDSTMIIFSSDHGEYLGDHHLRNKKLFFNQTMHIPYIIKNPLPEADNTRGKILDDFVESIDSAPTILSFLDVNVPSRYQGKSLLPRLKSSDNKFHKSEIFHEWDYRNSMSKNTDQSTLSDKVCWVVRDKSYSFIQFAEMDVLPLLFDLSKDPYELNNIANDDENIKILYLYSQKLLKWRMKNEDQRMQVWYDSV